MTTPNDTTYQQNTILAGIIAQPDRAPSAFGTIPVERFDFPMRHVARAMTRLRLKRLPITVPALEDVMRHENTLDLLGMAELWSLAPDLGNPYMVNDDSFHYALNAIARDVQRRVLTQQARATATLVEESPDVDVIEAADGLERTLDSVRAHVEAAMGEAEIPTLDEFLDVEDPEFDWVIPGLLEHGDRMILTGYEGLGKSTILRQIAVCAAAGVHPFEHTRIPQKRVLIVDCENKAVPSRRVLRPLRLATTALGTAPDKWLNVEVIDGGLQLDRAEEEIRLVNLVTAAAPDLLVIGPVYYLHSRDGNEEDTGRAVTRVLDRCRTIANCAIITEAHMGHGMNGQKRPIRPVGTSLWLRWPDLGYGIVPTKEHTEQRRSVRMVSWRGDRHERHWPKHLVGGGRLPWTIDYGVSQGDETASSPLPYKD